MSAVNPDDIKVGSRLRLIPKNEFLSWFSMRDEDDFPNDGRVGRWPPYTKEEIKHLLKIAGSDFTVSQMYRNEHHVRGYRSEEGVECMDEPYMATDAETECGVCVVRLVQIRWWMLEEREDEEDTEELPDADSDELFYVLFS